MEAVERNKKINYDIVWEECGNGFNERLEVNR